MPMRVVARGLAVRLPSVAFSPLQAEEDTARSYHSPTLPRSRSRYRFSTLELRTRSNIRVGPEPLRKPDDPDYLDRMVPPQARRPSRLPRPKAFRSPGSE